jgi:hypothetical protein
MTFQFLGHPGIGRTRHLGGNRRNTRFMPAYAGIDNRRASSLNCLGKLYYLFQRRAAFDQIEHGQAIDDDEIAADFFADTRTISTGKRMRFSYAPPHSSSLVGAAAMNSLIR